MSLPKSPCLECKRRPCPKICYPKKDFDRAFMKAYRKMLDEAFPQKNGGRSDETEKLTKKRKE